MSTSSQPAPTATAPRVRLDFASGGWVLLLAGIICVGFFGWAVSATLRSERVALRGDGRNVASYGFTLEPCLVDRAPLVAGGIARDELHALVDPPVDRAADVNPEKKFAGVRKLWPSDRVVGVRINDEIRAYPLWVLTWHEIVNDTVGGEPILVTYSPLCDSVAVFERRVGGEVAEFGVSGLLHNSNLLMFDRRTAPADESLWSQLQFRAIAGPAAANGETLKLLPAAVVTWGEWTRRFPETTVVRPRVGSAVPYKRDAYLPYFGDEKLRFPVSPMPPPRDGLGVKTRVLAVRDGEAWRLRRLDSVRGVDEWLATPSVHAFWFAWHAQHPSSTTFE